MLRRQLDAVSFSEPTVIFYIDLKELPSKCLHIVLEMLI